MDWLLNKMILSELSISITPTTPPPRPINLLLCPCIDYWIKWFVTSLPRKACSLLRLCRLWTCWDQASGMFGIITPTRKHLMLSHFLNVFQLSHLLIDSDLFRWQHVCWNGCLHCHRSNFHIGEDAFKRVSNILSPKRLMYVAYCV